jgi:hypothetical protein
MKKQEYIVSGGIGIGSALALIISWSINHSLLWALIHGMLGWAYIFYYIILL